MGYRRYREQREGDDALRRLKFLASIVVALVLPAVAFAGGGQRTPSWAPDGTIVYSLLVHDRTGCSDAEYEANSLQCYEIFRYNPATGLQDRLTWNDSYDAEVSVCPDNTIVYVDRYGVAGGSGNLRRMAADGSWNQVLIAAWGLAPNGLPNHAGDPNCAPDGSGRIAFTYGAHGQGRIYIYSKAGVTRLTDYTPPSFGYPADYAPDWSPDANRIVFSRPVGTTYDLFTINADGSALTQRTFTPTANEWDPDWNNYMYYTRGANGEFDIWRGIGYPTPIVTNPGKQDTQPDLRGNTLLYTQDYYLALFTVL